MVSDTDDNGVVKLPLVLQLLKQPGKQIVHQPGLEIGAVRLLVACKPPKFRVLFQRPIAQDFIVLVAQMGRTGDDEVQGRLPLPEEFGIQTGIVKQQLIVIQKVFLVRTDVVPVADVFRIPHGGREHAAAVEAGIVIVEGLGRIPLLRQQAGEGLAVGVRDVVESIAALTAQERAGIHAELRIEGADAAVARRVEVGERNTLGHEPFQRGGVLPDHPVVHGLHEHQNHVFPFQQAGHFVVAAHSPVGKIGVDLRFPCLLRRGVAWRQGVDAVFVDVLFQRLVQAADLIQPVGIEHVVIGRLSGLDSAVVGGSVPDVAVLHKHRLRQAGRSYRRGDDHRRSRDSG